MPIKSDQFYFMLGLAMRAGKLTLGEDAGRKAAASGSAIAVLLDEEASLNAQKALSDTCGHMEIPLYRTQAGRLGQAVGRPGRMCAALAGGSLGERLLELAREELMSG